MNNVLTIQEISRRSGVSASALRFYEERGLISSERADSGHRRFARELEGEQKVGMVLKDRLKELDGISIISELHGAHGLEPGSSLALWQIFFRFYTHMA